MAQSSDPWSIDSTEFPSEGSAEEQSQFLVRYAILAPSSHNTQPWVFSIEERTITLYRDLERWLEVADEDQRELHLSLGCALENLLVAARFYQFQPDVQYDHPAESDRVVTVSLEPEASEPSPDIERFFQAIPNRRTNHQPFRDQPLTKRDRQSLESLVRGGDVRAHFVDDRDRIRELEDLHEQANRRQFRDPDYREELGLWIGRGVFGDSWLKSHIGKLVVTYVDLGNSQASKDRELIESSPLMVLLGTDVNTREHQIRTGQLAERLWLDATARELGVQPLSAALEVPDLKGDLGRLFEIAHPQHLFRVGIPTESEEPTPRRPLKEVLQDR